MKPAKGSIPDWVFLQASAFFHGVEAFILLSVIGGLGLAPDASGVGCRCVNYGSCNPCFCQYGGANVEVRAVVWSCGLALQNQVECPFCVNDGYGLLCVIIEVK